MVNPSPFEQVLEWFTIIENMSKEKLFKPILLLTVIAEIEDGSIQTNEITYSKSIKDRFDSFYDDLGNRQGFGKSHLPFFHLQSDLWSFALSSNSSIVTRSKKSLQGDIKFAKFNSNLFDLLLVQTTRELIKDRLFLKAEEDIKTIDIGRNSSFKPPSNISDILRSNFGNLSIKPDSEYLNLGIEDEILERNSTFEFESERILQDEIVEYWDNIPNLDGWRIYEGPPYGVEFQVEEAGRIDILAESKINNQLKVIELKKGLGKAEHLGQLLRYVGWIRSKLAVNQDVFGTLVASQFKDGIHYAWNQLDAIELWRYDSNLNFIEEKM